MNFEFKKHCWHNDDPFVRNIWLINYLFREYESLKVKFEIKDDVEKILTSQSLDFNKEEENKARSFF